MSIDMGRGHHEGIGIRSGLKNCPTYSSSADVHMRDEQSRKSLYAIPFPGCKAVRRYSGNRLRGFFESSISASDEWISFAKLQGVEVDLSCKLKSLESFETHSPEVSPDHNDAMIFQTTQ